METPIKLTNGYHNGHAEVMKNDIVKDLKSKAKDAVPHIVINNVEKVNKYMNGPEQIVLTDEYTCTTAEGYVKLRVAEEGIAAEPPLSVPGLINRIVARYPDTIAMASKCSDGSWEKVTYREYQQKIFTCAKGFLKLGLERHHSVAILGFNSAEWFISDLAAIHAGGVAAGIYTTNSPEACYYVLNNSQANIVVVDDDKQMEKILSVWPRLPKLKAAIQWEGEPKRPRDNIYSWKELMEIGKKESDEKLNQVIKSIAINECCTLVYTSGTVGLPKGTMLSHDNLTYEAHIISERVRLQPGRERIISFLPLSHVAAQMVDLYFSTTNAVTIYFADKDALKGSLLSTLKEVQPTCFIAVPRVWEKMYEKMMAIGESNGTLKKMLAGWAKQQSLNHHMAKLNGSTDVSYGYRLAKALVLSRVQVALGLNHCRLCISAAAPLAGEIEKYFVSLDLPLLDVYGMSEVSGAHTLSVLSAYRIESVGKPLKGIDTKFYNIDPTTGEGEICMRGRHLFMGYLNDPEKTKEAVDEDGWIHSGDVGKEKDGFIYITGRIKELLITAGGENIAPVLIEMQIKNELPVLSQAVVIGDRKKFLSVLLTLQSEVDSKTGIPKDELNPYVLNWLSKIGSNAKTVTELLNAKDPKVWQALQDGIDRANKHAISNAQRIQKFDLLPMDFSIATGELGPTMKLKRNFVVSKYEDVINKLYM